MFWVTLFVVVYCGSNLFFHGMAYYKRRLDVETEATLKRAAKIRQNTDRMRRRQENQS